MTTAKTKQGRVNFRVPLSVKQRFAEAAAFETGGDLSAFLIAAGLERADRVLSELEVVRIDDTMRARFYAAMRAPARPSEALRQLLNEDDPRLKLVE